MNNFNVPQNKATKKDGIFLFFSFVVSFLFMEFLLCSLGLGLGIGVAIFFGALHLCAALYLRKSKLIFSKLSIVTFIPVLILMLIFLLSDSSLWFLNLIALWFFSCVNLLSMAGLLEYPFKAGIFGDVFKVTFWLTLADLDKRITSFSFKKKTGARKLLFVIITLLVISPAVIIVTMLLSSADNNFGSMIEKIANALGDKVLEYFLKTLFALFLTFPLFNLLYKLKNNQPETEKTIKAHADLKKLDPICPGAALSVFSLIYILYISLQAGYLFSALSGVLPKDFTYAEYARRGFFELTAVVFFNIFVMAFVFIFTKRKSDKLPPILQILSTLMVLCTVLLIFTALSKMGLYINTYGLTPMRVYTSWFMIMLLICAFYLMIKIFAPKFKLSQFTAYTAVIMFLILNIANTDVLIARYNINRYNETGKIDSSVFYSLSDSAVPLMAKLKDDSKVGDTVRNSFKERKREFEIKSFSNRSISEYIAYYYYLK